jgi:hypothetical protein
MQSETMPDLSAPVAIARPAPVTLHELTEALEKRLLALFADQIQFMTNWWIHPEERRKYLSLYLAVFDDEPILQRMFPEQVAQHKLRLMAFPQPPF